MVTKSLKLDDKLVENLELAIKGLNEKTGANIYDFSNVVRIALNKYLESEDIKEIINSVKNAESENKKNVLFVSESSLSKDWMSTEEDETWADL
jgi:hypothetical protein